MTRKADTDTSAATPAATETEAPAPAPQPDDWSPPEVDPDTGHTLVAGFPLAGPARLAALVKARRKTDPAGVVTPEQIADAAGQEA